MAEPDFRRVVGPLFDGGQVAVVEWTLDAGWEPFVVPDWADRILSHYGGEGRLLAHGFAFSPLSGAWHPRQDAWLRNLRAEVSRRTYRHLSEHFCFSFAGDFEVAGPLPAPMTARSVELGRDRLARLADASGLPVGLENLATALGVRDALDQGEFLERLLSPTGGFVLLDLHNLYCQLANFDLSPDVLLASYPLARVRELHLSGGSWDPTAADPPGRPARRDTHDDAVPDAVFDLLELALERCPNVEAVILERLPGTFRSEDDAVGFRRDYARMVATLRARSAPSPEA